MKLEDLASLMKISKEELVEQLKKNDVIELKLTESKNGIIKDKCKIEILE